MMLSVYLSVALLVIDAAEPFGSSHDVLDVHFQDQCIQRCPFQVSNTLFIKDVLKSTTCQNSSAAQLKGRLEERWAVLERRSVHTVLI
jgi:hypothetical protein